jgi:hypothetical protein
LAGQWVGLAGRDFLGFFHHESAWGGALAGRWRVGFNEERRKKLPSPAARPGEGERGTVSFKTTLFCTLFFLHETAPFYLKVAPASFFQISS